MRLYRVLIGIVLLASVAIYLANNPNAKTPLKFATNHWLGYEPLYVAKDLQLIDSNKLNIFTLSSTTDVFRALRHGEVAGAALTLDEVLLLSMEGYPLTIVGVADISHGADSVMLSNRYPTDVHLAGMRIAYEGNVLGAYMVARMLEKKGLNLLDVALVEAAPHEHAAMLERGEVDAVVTYEPFVTRLKTKATSIFSSRDIPGEIVDVMAVDLSQAKPEHIAHLLDIWRLGVAQISASEPHVMQNVASRHQLDVNELKSAFEDIAFPNTGPDYQQVMFLDSEQLTRTARRVWQVMQHVGLGPALSRMPKLEIKLEGLE
ncbi:MAG TPA: ABC transporter substrate-binding protein [Pseudomonadales bacterium]|nr:ABC transporter substrate-binding protein [Pseudomonadales bacterium]